MSDKEEKEEVGNERAVLRDDEGNELYTTPSRGELTGVARKLLLSTAQSTPQQIKSVKTNSFFRHCCRLMEEICPDEEDDIKEVLLDLFLQFRIRSEVGLSLLTPPDLPDSNVRPIWGVLTFRRGLQLLIQASRKVTFDVLTSVQGIMKEVGTSSSATDGAGDEGDKSVVDGSATLTKSNSEFNLKAIQQITLKEYSGESDKYQEWFESTERQFGRAAAQPLLHDDKVCTENLEVSYAAKCIVATSLENGSASYLNTTYKTEKNLALFMRVLDNCFNSKVDARTREFVQWKRLFTLNMEKAEEADEFINDFETCVSKLREHKSTAVSDDALMRALILHAVRAEEFKEKKLEITANLKMSMTEVIASVRNHFIALRTNDNLTGDKPGSKNISFARDVKRGRKGEGSILKTSDGSNMMVPPFPKDLDKVVSDSVMERLNRWRKLCNKKNKSDWELKLLMTPNFQLYRDKERPLKPPNKVKAKQDDDEVGEESRKRKRRKSSKSSRYSDDRKRIRRSDRRDSFSSISSKDDDSTVGVYSTDEEIVPRNKNKNKHKSPRKKKGGDDRDNKRKFRRSTNDPVGIIVRKRSSRV